MKKFLSLFMIVILLLGTTCIAQADTTDIKEISSIITQDITTKVGEYGTTQAIPEVKCEDNRIILVAAPAPAMKAWYECIPTWQAKFPGTSYSARYDVDIKFDDGEWYSIEQSQNPNISAWPFNLSFDIPSSEIQTLELVNLARCNPDDIAWDALSNVITTDENGNYTIDFSAHTLYIKLVPTFNLETQESAWTTSHSQVLECSFHDGKVELETELAQPQVKSAIFNIPEETLALYMDYDAMLDSLFKLGYTVQADVVMYVNNEEAAHKNIQITQNQQTLYISSKDYPNEITDEDAYRVHVKYIIQETNQESPESIFVPELQREKNPTLRPGNQDGVAIQDDRCALCKSCPVQPLNICLFVWGAWGVALVGIITSVIILIKRRKDTKHE